MPVVARWALLPVVAAVALYIALFANFLPRGLLYVALLPAAALFILMCARIAPSHKRTVAVATFLIAAAFVMRFVPYPNIGLPFGYWVYPNRAITAFLECPNVQSARVERWNHDTGGIEEFEVDVTISDQSGRTITRGISFGQYPTQEYIAARVASIGC